MESFSSERLPALARVSALLRAGLPARETLNAVLAEIPSIIPSDGYAIWRYHHRSHEWRIVASSGLSRDYVDHTIPEQRTGETLHHGPFAVADVFAWPIAEHRRAFYDAEGIRSLLS